MLNAVRFVLLKAARLTEKKKLVQVVVDIITIY